MKIDALLEKLKAVPEIQVEERIHPDGTRVYIFSTIYPFPRVPEPAWYPIVLEKEQSDVDDEEIEAMQRHLWMFQLNIVPRRVRLGVPRIAASQQVRSKRPTPKRK